MQVSLTATGGLERRLEVAIPAAQVDGEVAQRLTKISRTARLKGFRPGKAPIAVIRQQYGEQVHGEVINDLMRASFSEAVAREKLNPAGGPRIEPIAMNPGADLKYAAVFEVLPEVRLQPIADLALERPIASVATQISTPCSIRCANSGRRSTKWRAAPRQRSRDVDFVGKIDGAEFDGGTGAAVPIVIGANQVMKEFEDALLGAKPANEREFNATFRRAHQQEARRRKTATFNVKISRSRSRCRRRSMKRSPRVSALPTAASKTCARSARQHGARAQEAIRQKVRAQVLEALYTKNPLELPRQLVDEQIQELQVEMLRRAGVKDAKQLPPREPFEQPARRRVALSLLMSELVRSANLKVSREAVRKVERTGGVLFKP
jgi:trigger factor